MMSAFTSWARITAFTKRDFDTAPTLHPQVGRHVFGWRAALVMTTLVGFSATVAVQRHSGTSSSSRATSSNGVGAARFNAIREGWFMTP